MSEQIVEQKEHFHGSDLEKIEKYFGIKKEDITSFSANVNPLGVSPLLRSTLSERIDAITAYPDREYTALRKSIGAYANTDPDNILIGNGATELISLFIQIRQPKKAMILAPAYSEYEREVTLSGGEVVYYTLREEDEFRLNTEALLSSMQNIDLLILCNPNNPTSTIIPREDLRKILSFTEANGTSVMIDETYVEFAPDTDAVTAVPLVEEHKNLVVLRGISKFFAAPGLRLGYAITGNRALIDKINEKKNPWTVNSLAEVAGQIMFGDTEYIRATKELIDKERSIFVEKLSLLPSVKIYAPSANFILVRILKEGLTAYDLFEHAIKKGLMIRDCSTFESLDDSYFRFCFMSPEKNRELLNCLLELLA